MNADSAFNIGVAHAVCQDYAIAGNGRAHQEGNSRASPYVVLSDGCSSSPDSDIGARLLVKAAELRLRARMVLSARQLADAHRESARHALIWARRLGLASQAIDATLLTAHLNNDDLILACSGDGVIVLKSWTGALDVYAINYPSGYPLYPSYAHQRERLQALKQEGRTCKEVRHYRGVSSGESIHLEETDISNTLTEVFSVKSSEYRCAAVVSDGIHSFFTTHNTETSKRVEGIPMESLLNELVSFKTVHGLFVGRRLKSFLKECQSKGWQHRDDLAIGALHLEG